jgi:hypothetical protein
MGFHRLSPSVHDGDLHDRVQWANKWLKENVSSNDPFPIQYCILYGTGLMVVTKHYKAYLHEGSQDYEDMVEAITIFASEKQPEHMLYCELTKKAKPIILRNDEELCNYWHRTEDRFVQVFTPPLAETEEKPRENPLLAGRGVQGKSRAKKQAGDKVRPTEAS